MNRFIRLLHVEFRKTVQEKLGYYPDLIVGILVLLILFAGLFSLQPDGAYFSASTYYIGFIYWFFSNGIISQSSMSISDEKQMGTFEQLLIKPSGLTTILFVRSIVWLAFKLIEVTVVMLALRLVLSIPMAVSLSMIPVFLVTMLGLVGISYILSALTVLFTKTASFDTVLSYILLFFTGAVSNAQVAKNAFYYCLPLAQGINITRSLLDNKQNIQTQDYLFLILNSLFFLGLGIILFALVMKRGRTKGFSMTY